jgi:hypothetical protein
MKRTRQVSATEAEAEAWLVRHPYSGVRDCRGLVWTYGNGQFLHCRFWHDSLPRHLSPYTITEEIDEPDRFEQQRDELEKWLSEKEIEHWARLGHFGEYQTQFRADSVLIRQYQSRIADLKRDCEEEQALRIKIQREREEEVRHVESENDRLLIRNQHLKDELEKLKAENESLKSEVKYMRDDIKAQATKKGYKWKNCGESMTKSCRWLPLRPIGSRWASALAYRENNNKWKMSAGAGLFTLPDPENWEFLELEE